MVYQALTFDAQTVITNSFDFDGGVLNQLRTLKHDTIQILISEIVRSEVFKHLTLHNQQVASQLKSALKRARDFGILEAGPDISGGEEAAKGLATSRLAKYFTDLNARVIGSSQLTVTDLMTRYFQNLPPFSNGKKKAEFPDAVSLLSLEAWAKENNAKILAISGDGDWVSFAEASDYIDIVPDVPTALNRLNGQANHARILAGEFIDKVDARTDENLYNSTFLEISSALDNVSFTAEGDSYHHVEGEEAYVTLEAFKFMNPGAFDLIFSDEPNKKLVISVNARLFVEAEASFFFSAYDTIDHDYVSLGGSDVSAKKELDAQLMILLNYEAGPFEVEHVDFVKITSVIDFGVVEPDFSNEYYEEDH